MSEQFRKSILLTNSDVSCYINRCIPVQFGAGRGNYSNFRAGYDLMSSEDIYIDSYRLVAGLGYGTFGSVYLAQHAILTDRVVAIKVLHPIHLGPSQDLIRFFTEAQILDKLKYP